jgi:hypothetical protein
MDHVDEGDWHRDASVLRSLVAIERGQTWEAARALADELSRALELGFGRPLRHALEALAAAFARGGDPERAAVLAAQAQALRRSLGVAPDPYSAALQHRVTETARRELGEAAFRAATERGAAMSIEDAVEYALAPMD